MNSISKKVIGVSTGLALLSGALMAMPALAADINVNAQVNTNKPPQGEGWGRGGMMGKPGEMGNRGPGMMKPGVVGKVTAINGTTLTLAGRQGFGTSTTATTFTVDASNAVVKKDNATTTLSSVVVNDEVFAQGTVNGTNVTATLILDGMGGRMMGRGGKDGEHGGIGSASSTLAVIGNGQPVIAGTLSAISGSSLTVTTTSNVTYTVDASAAKFLQGQTTSALSNLVVGDKIVVQGTVNGTSIAASTVIDQKAPGTTPGNGNGKPQGQGMGGRGIFGGIGQFFAHLFGF